MGQFTHNLLLTLFALTLIAFVNAACKGSQSYVLSVRTSFTPATTAIVPQKASIPVLIAVAHKKGYSLYEEGSHLRDSVAEVVRTAGTNVLEIELRKHIANNSVSSFSIISFPNPNAISKMEVRVREDASYISLIAPLSPSPDWFIGPGEPVNLCSNGEFIEKRDAVLFKNWDSGLDKGNSFNADPDPYDDDETNPVGLESSIGEDVSFAQLSLEKGTLGVDWWKIFLGVLVGVAVLVVLIIFVLPRFKKKKPTELPLTAQDGVEW